MLAVCGDEAIDENQDADLASQRFMESCIQEGTVAGYFMKKGNKMQLMFFLTKLLHEF